MKFLNVVCEYEIVGVDRMEGPLTSALSVLNILFTSQIENKDKHSVQNLCKGKFIWIAPCEIVSSGICGQRRPRSDCASAQSDQGPHCLLTESSDTTECMNGEQRRR